MRFMMQIFQGEALDAWARLSEEEQQGIAAGYQAVNETPGVTPGEWLSPPDAATTVRLRDGAAVTTQWQIPAPGALAVLAGGAAMWKRRRGT